MKWIYPSRVEGTIQAPPSKSMMIRAVAAALLCEEEMLITNPSSCDDVQATLRVIEALGGGVEKSRAGLHIRGHLDIQESLVNCGESGLCIRLFSPIAALMDRPLTLTGAGSLKSRPMDMLVDPIQALGGYCATNNGYPPVRVKGPLKGGLIEVDGSLSSQFLTGLLMALPLCEENSEIRVLDLVSRPYIAMTLSVLSAFGITIDAAEDFSRFTIKGGQAYHAARYAVEGDWSGAAFPLVAGAVAGRVTVTGLSLETPQGDRLFLEALKTAGAKLTVTESEVTAERDRLEAFSFDARECPDLFPPLALLACCCRGCSVIEGVERLRHKESDRALAIVEELGQLGGRIKLTADRLEITGAPLKGGRMDSRHDHRIAMAGALAGLVSRDGVAVDNWQVVTKSYPQFFQDIKSLGGNLT